MEKTKIKVYTLLQDDDRGYKKGEEFIECGDILIPSVNNICENSRIRLAIYIVETTNEDKFRMEIKDDE